MREQDEQATVGTKEAAKELNVLQATVSKLCREGKLPGATQDEKGSLWRIPVESIRKRKKQRGL